MLREDEYEEWERGHKQVNSMNKESLLIAEAYDKEHIKKYFTCCECPADYEISVLMLRCRLFSKDLITSTNLNSQNEKQVARNFGIKRKSCFPSFINF